MLFGRGLNAVAESVGSRRLLQAGSARTLLPGLVAHPNLVVAGLRDGNDLAAAQVQAVTGSMEVEANARDLQTVVVQPQHAGRQLRREVAGRQEDSRNRRGDLVTPLAEVLPYPLLRVFFFTPTDQVVLVSIDDLGEGHVGHHGGVAHGLEVHVVARLGALEFDDDQSTAGVQRQQVDASPRVLPVAVLLSDDEEFVFENVGRVSKGMLEILFLQFFGLERDPAYGLQVIPFPLVQFHSSPPDQASRLVGRGENRRAKLPGAVLVGNRCRVATSIAEP